MSSKQIVLITGANTGLGLEVVRALAKTDTAYEIIVGSRSLEKGQAAVETVKKELPQTPSKLGVAQIDLESDDSIKKAYDEVSSKHGRVDVLINNGGAGFDREIQLGNMSIREAWNKSWDINVTGTEVMTHAFVPLLLRSSDPRLMFVTSGTSTLTETERLDGPMYARLNGSPAAGWPKLDELQPVSSYRSSKTGLNMAMREWNRKLRNDGVKVWAISPGFLATGLGGAGLETLKKMGAKDPAEGGQFIKDVVQGKRDQDVGKIVRFDMLQPW